MQQLNLIFIPFFKDSGELFEIKFVNTSKDLYTLGRVRPFYYELSLEPFKYNDESLDTGIDAIDDVIALGWEEDNDEVDFNITKRLVFRFGETQKNIEDKLYERDIVLEFEKKVIYETE